MKCRTCEHCGANLDFGERCDCLTVERRDADPHNNKPEKKEEKDGGAKYGRI